ncbi:hypothetical protein [Hymenobacter psychrotolerans]|uniref:Uncharacterized protein n=1 Tax=Hymenobacter psychrotolerans DSM 18569 TaxID=1121959 RepID=A0A1M6W027_9BACT|nr:hypothetical protein [Hymenobacter psychrotolerans]SHK86946.1 hypothetical protein SAMN02746009_01702 [Hymenobacter psychrotolerans DSM 18569]
MQTNHPDRDNPSRADNEFEQNQAPENIQDGTQRAGTAPQAAGMPGATSTPQYGDFGHAPEAAAPRIESRPAGNNPGGTAAPSYTEPDQRGSVPQNLAPGTVQNVENAEYDEQRAGWAKDDPRYGSGTRNWETEEPANPTTAPADDSGRKASNDGSNDNPDEFSSLRPDNGRGIPGK